LRNSPCKLPIILKYKADKWKKAINDESHVHVKPSFNLDNQNKQKFSSK